jgi:hypothetical protein
MNEEELKHALRGVMTATPAPAPMNGTAVLDAARHARRRHRATLAGGASAAAVVLIAAGAIIVPSLTRDGGGSSLFGAGGGPAVQPTSNTVANPPDTKTSWPDGQTDRTARQGPRADKATQLLALVDASVPAAWRAPADLKPAPGVDWSGGLRMSQAQYADQVGDKQIWEYMVVVPVGANGKWGRVAVEVHTPGGRDEGEGCDLTAKFWGMGGQCELVPVGDKQVGVAVRPTSDERFDQWAGYRHPDGTVVFVGQAKSYFMTGLPATTELPFTPQQLAALAADPKFHLD